MKVGDAVEVVLHVGKYRGWRGKIVAEATRRDEFLVEFGKGLRRWFMSIELAVVDAVTQIGDLVR